MCLIGAGLSELHKRRTTVIKNIFESLKPKVTHYEDCKNFCNDIIREYLLSTLLFENFNINCNGSQKFLQVYIKALDRFLPCKKKIFQAKKRILHEKKLGNILMQRSQLRTKYIQNRSISSKIPYNRQRSYCVTFIFFKIEKDYYANLVEKDAVDCK